ncbi:MAG: hypothetical protein FWH43_08670, partial [Endomicrobia bacterium]|nr:hypothetical protein [Endomicrobiia bacterium]
MIKKDLFQGLIDIGKEQGYLTYEEINKSIPQKSMIAEKIDSFFVTLDDLGIKVVDNKEYLSDKAQKSQHGEAVEQTVKAASDDEDINPVRMYLSEMAKVPLLERAVEVELAKNIRENEKKLKFIVLESPLIVKEIRNWETLISQQEMTPKELMPRGRKSQAQLRGMGVKIKKAVQKINRIEKNMQSHEARLKLKSLSQKERAKIEVKIKQLRTEVINLIIGLNLNQDKIKRLINKIKTTAQKLNEIKDELRRFERKFKNSPSKVQGLYKQYKSEKIGAAEFKKQTGCTVSSSEEALANIEAALSKQANLKEGFVISPESMIETDKKIRDLEEIIHRDKMKLIE